MHLHGHQASQRLQVEYTSTGPASCQRVQAARWQPLQVLKVFLNVVCSTGWLSHWGEPMANTSLDQFIDTLHGTLGFANNTGSVNLYMAHGGTNFGFTAGAS